MVGAVPGISGRLISSSFAQELLPSVPGYEVIPAVAARAIELAVRKAATMIGPASSRRAIADVVVVPLLEALGFSIERRVDDPRWCALELRIDSTTTTTALVIGYNEPLSPVWRGTVRHGAAADAGWAFCSNGVSLRLVDARRTWSRDYVEFALSVVAESTDTQSVLWSLASARSFASPSPLIDRAVALSARHGIDVCRALGDGVLHALQAVITALAPRAARRFPPDVLFEHSLTVLYRVLFLLFAEARGLVPLWHPVYRDRYSLEAIVVSLMRHRHRRGLWRALQAISHLAHAGCAAGELSVTAFNGRLFAPAQAAAFDQTRVDDSVLAEAIVAVASTPAGGSRRRIAFRDLDVEQLGAVYERVLDFQPQPAGTGITLVRAGDTRKATGTFYTPRAVAGYLVRQTLAPLVNGRTADDVLNLRILDPAMGSGAFLVAACRFLASTVEQALVREGQWHPHDITAADRSLLRRQIAARCLFGVDLNPTAVQLARLSLWLATLSANKPLSFLDHHLVAGNSLVGARPVDLQRQPSGGRRRSKHPDPLPLFDVVDLSSTLAGGVDVRSRLAAESDDSAAVVSAKERALAALMAPDGALGRWSRALDLWCGGWFWEMGTAPDRPMFGELLARLLAGQGQLPPAITSPLLDHAASLAARHRFLHWPLAFPEVFCTPDGSPRTDGGFDAIIGNPPWDMVRGDSGDESSRRERQADARRLTDFVRESGIYTAGTQAHANRYQLFVERALQLVRPGGRIGFVLPSGIASDAGAAPLRRFLFDRTEIDELTGFDNRHAIFPIHRSVRFVLLTATSGRSTSAIQCRFGISAADALERPSDPASNTVTLTRAFLSRLSGSDDLGIPELSGDEDLRLLERISATVPRLGSADGWNGHFGRELNASDDRQHLEPRDARATARPVLEGKQIDPFRVDVERSRYQLAAGAPDRVPRRTRLAYRDVASATNRLTLIAAMIPARAVTTHTLFCLKTPHSLAAQHVLCGLLNSFVANYLVRFRVHTHVTASLVSRLPVPFIEPDDAVFERIAALVRVLLDAAAAVEDMEEYAELQARVARLYQMSGGEFEHVLSTFPLIPERIKSKALAMFNRYFSDTHLAASPFRSTAVPRR